MPLEAVMIVVDNSESSRNGDYVPTRFEAQVDATNILFQSITGGNPESKVGLMSMAGKGPEVLSTLTDTHGRILEGLHRTKNQIKGSAELAVGLQVASLALKHRQNKMQRQRIIAFVCSPVADEEKKLTSLARRMKKSNISVDFVLFGDLDDETQKKLTAFNETVKGSEGSYLVTIPPSGKLLSDQLHESPILMGDHVPSTSGGGSGGGMGGDFELDFDPELEPELALALRMSLEEEKARKEKEEKAQREAEATKGEASKTTEGEASKASDSDKPSADDDAKTKGDDDKMDTS